MDSFRQKNLEPVWRSLVGNQYFREANKGAIEQERERVRLDAAESRRAAREPSWKEADGGRLVREWDDGTVEEADAEGLIDDPVLGRLAERSLFQRDVKALRSERDAIRHKLADPLDDRRLSDSDRESLAWQAEAQRDEGESDEEWSARESESRAARERLERDRQRREEERRAWELEGQERELLRGGIPEWRRLRSVTQAAEVRRREAEVAEVEREAAKPVTGDRLGESLVRREEAAEERAALDGERATAQARQESEQVTAQAAVAGVTPPQEQARLRFEAAKMLGDAGRVSEGAAKAAAAPGSGGGRRMIERATDFVGALWGGIVEGGEERGFMDFAVRQDDLRAAEARIRENETRNAVETKQADTVASFIKWFEGNGVTDGRQMATILRDSLAERAWTNDPNDKVRVLSTGEVTFNPALAMTADPSEAHAAIQSASAPQESRDLARAAYDNFREEWAVGMHQQLLARDAEGYRAHASAMMRAAEASGQPVTPSQILTSWDGLKRNNWRTLGQALASASRGIGMSAGNTLAGVFSAIGAKGLGADMAEAAAQVAATDRYAAELATVRGERQGGWGVAFDLVNTGAQMAPMFAGGAIGRGIAGIGGKAAKALGGAIGAAGVYGWAGIQGYGSMMQRAIEKAQAEGRTDIAAVIDETQGEALANAFQTAILSKILGGGVERAAFGRFSAELGELTARDVVKQFVKRGGKDGIRATVTALKPELKAMTKTILGDVADEAVEEGLNQIIEETIAKLRVDPNASWGDIVRGSLYASALGGLLGGGMPVAQKNMRSNDRRELHVAAQKAFLESGGDPAKVNAALAAAGEAGASAQELAEAADIAEWGAAKENEEVETAMLQYQQQRDSGDMAGAAQTDRRISELMGRREAKDAEDIAAAVRIGRQLAGADAKLASQARGALKIAQGRGIDTLTDGEARSLGVYRDADTARPMSAAELKAEGLAKPLVDVGADGTPILLDEVAAAVRQVSPEAAARIRLTETQARQKAKERANEQNTQGQPQGAGQAPAQQPQQAPPAVETGAGGTAQAQGAGEVAAAPSTAPSMVREMIVKRIKGNARLRKIVKFTNDPQVRARYANGNVEINPEAMGAVVDALPEAQREAWVSRVIDHEIRHAAHMDAARKTWKKNGSPGTFEDWRNDHYGRIWNEEFDDAKREIVTTAYGPDAANLQPWQLAFEGLRMMSQEEAGVGADERAKLWTNLGSRMVEHLRAMLESLASMVANLPADSVLHAELKAIRRELKKYEAKPEAGNAGVAKPAAGQKPVEPVPAPAEKGAGKPPAERQPEQAPSKPVLPTGQDGLKKGDSVTFKRDGKRIAGTIKAISEDGKIAFIELDKPDPIGLRTATAPVAGLTRKDDDNLRRTLDANGKLNGWEIVEGAGGVWSVKKDGETAARFATRAEALDAAVAGLSGKELPAGIVDAPPPQTQPAPAKPKEEDEPDRRMAHEMTVAEFVRQPDTRTDRRKAAIREVDDAIKRLGREVVGTVFGLKPDESTVDWLDRQSNETPTWSKGRKQGQTALEKWGKKPSLPIFRDEVGGEQLRKAVLAYIRGKRATWLEKGETLSDTKFTTAASHRVIVERSVREGRDVPVEVLRDYAGQPWADQAIAKLESPSKPVEQAQPEQPTTKPDEEEGQGQGQGLQVETPAGQAPAALSEGDRKVLAVLDGLYASSPIAEYARTIPPDRFMALMDAASTWFAEGVTTPERLAAKLENLIPGGRAIPFTQSLWFALKAVGAEGPAEPGWGDVYGSPKQTDAQRAAEAADTAEKVKAWVIQAGNGVEGASDVVAEIRKSRPQDVDAAEADVRSMLEPEPVKAPAPQAKAAVKVARKSATDPKKLKAQKEYLLAALDKAIEEAPDSQTQGFKFTDQGVRDWEDAVRYVRYLRSGVFAPKHEKDLRDLFAKYGVTPDESLTSEAALSRLTDAINLASYIVPDAAKVIEIEVPGDGTFRVVNDKQTLRDFRKNVNARFPTTAARPTYPTSSTPRETAITKLGEPKTNKDFLQIVAEFVTDDETRFVLMNVHSDGENLVATDGRSMMIVKREVAGKIDKPVHFDGKTLKIVKPEDAGTYPDWRIAVPREFDAEHEIDTGTVQKIVIQARSMADKGDDVSKKALAVWQDADGRLGFTLVNHGTGTFSGGPADPETSKILAKLDVFRFFDGLAAMRRLGHAKANLRFSNDMLLMEAGEARFILKGLRGGTDLANHPLSSAEAARIAEQEAKDEEAKKAQAEQAKKAEPAEAKPQDVVDPNAAQESATDVANREYRDRLERMKQFGDDSYSILTDSVRHAIHLGLSPDQAYQDLIAAEAAPHRVANAVEDVVKGWTRPVASDSAAQGAAPQPAPSLSYRSITDADTAAVGRMTDERLKEVAEPVLSALREISGDRDRDAAGIPIAGRNVYGDVLGPRKFTVTSLAAARLWLSENGGNMNLRDSIEVAEGIDDGTESLAPTPIPDLPRFAAEAIAQAENARIIGDLQAEALGEGARYAHGFATVENPDTVAKAKEEAAKNGWAWGDVLAKVREQLELNADFTKDGSDQQRLIDARRGKQGQQKEKEYRGFRILKSDGFQVGYTVETGKRGKGRKWAGYEIVHPEDGTIKLADTLKDAKAWVDQYMGDSTGDVAKSPRAELIDRLVRAMGKPMPRIVERIEFEGTDGTWRGPNGFPADIKKTGKSRIGGYVYQAPDGTTYGQRFKSRKDAEDAAKEARERDAKEIRESLEGESDEGLARQAAFWLKDAESEATTESPAPSPDITPQTELAKRGITVEKSTTKGGKTVWRVKGKTFDVKDTLKSLGAKWYDPAKAWTFFADEDPTEQIANALAGRPTEGSKPQDAPRDSGAGAGDAEDARLRELRGRLDGTADERRARGDALASVDSGTAALIRRGLNFGMPADVVEDQIEDIAMIAAAYGSGKPAFILGNGAGTGKTFVLGGAIRELRAKGAGPFIYVTMNQDLIEQIKADLADFGISDVRFHTYSEMSSKGIPMDSGAVLIFDEAHNVKNATSARGDKAQPMMGRAKFTIFASATPFENPVQAEYLAGTGLFNEAGGHVEWAKAFGASVRKREFYNPRTGRKEVEETVFWQGGKLEDGLAARQWFVRQGIMVTRPMRLPMEMVESTFSKQPVAKKWVDLHDAVTAAYDDAMARYRNEDGSIRDGRENAQVAMHMTNTVKRILEASKVEHAVREAKKLLEQKDASGNGFNVVIFVETKADRWIGRYQKSEFYQKRFGNDSRHYTYPEIAEMMDDWALEVKMAQNMGGDKPPRPFSTQIVDIARAMHEAGIDIELPSVEQEVVDGLGGTSKVGVYTGSVTGAKAKADKEAFLRGDKRVLVATMAKGGTGLSLHDKVGNRPTVQLNINLPWVATGVDQVSGRVARYGLQSKAQINWLFAANIPFERTLASRVGRRMRDMGALVKGIEMKAAKVLVDDFDFEGRTDVKQISGEVEVGEVDIFEKAERMEKARRQKGDQSHGFFETPFTLAALMTVVSGARGRLLEPSGGTGNLLRFARDKAASITAVEIRPDNFEKLKGLIPNANLIQGDFLEEAVGGPFDTIHMNPPFERKSGVGWQDMAHVIKAHGLLAPGGRLVAIVGEGGFFRSDNQSKEFRQFLSDNGAIVIKLPEGAFKNSGTGVRTRMIVMDAGGESGRTDIDLSDLSADSLRSVADAIPARDDSLGASSPISEMDAAYLAAVERGDMETAQRMVDEAAKIEKPDMSMLSDFDMENFPKNGWMDPVGRVVELDYDDSHNHLASTLLGKNDAEFKLSNDNNEIEFYVRLLKKGWISFARGYNSIGVTYFTPLTASQRKNLGDVAIFQDRELRTSLDNNKIPPVVKDASGNVIPLSQRFNPESDSILYASSPLPESVESLAEQQRAFRRTGMVIGRADLANVSKVPEVRERMAAVDEWRKWNATRETRKQWSDAAKGIVGDPEKRRRTIDKFLSNAALADQGDTAGTGAMAMTPEEQIAMQHILERQVMDANGDKAKLAEFAVTANAYRSARANLARALAAPRDPLMSPAERNRVQIASALFTLPEKQMRVIEARNLPPKEHKDAVRAAASERLEKIERELKKHLGVTLEEITRKEVKLSLSQNKVMDGILAKRSPAEKLAAKLLRNQAGVARIRKITGLPEARILELNAEIRGELRAKLAEMVKSGLKAENLSDAFKGGLEASSPVDLGLTKEQEEEIERIISAGFGFRPDPEKKAKLPKARAKATVTPDQVDWTRPEFTTGLDSYTFDTKDRAEIMKRVVALRDVVGAAGTAAGLTGKKRAEADKMIGEIEAILAKKGASIAKVVADERAASRYAFDPSDRVHVAILARTISAMDADWVDKAQEYYYSALLSGIQTMMVNALGVVNTMWQFGVERWIEASANLFFKNPDNATFREFKYVSKAIGPMLARAWGNAVATWGAETPFFEEDILNQSPDFERISEGLRGYRQASIKGLKGRILRTPTRVLMATDDFMNTARAVAEVGAMAYRLSRRYKLKEGTEEFDKFMAAQVNEAGSLAWQMAAQKALEGTFNNALPGQKDATKRPVKVRGIVDLAGRMVESVSHTFRTEEDDSHIRKMLMLLPRMLFFPFVRVPFNILKQGIERSVNPISLVDLSLLMAQNVRFKGGRFTFNADGGGKLIVESVAKQFQGATVMALLYALSEGDDDDLEKPFLFTGSRPMNETKRGERDLGYRMGTNAYTISWSVGGKRYSINYGRIEPAATVLGGTVDTLRAVKQKIRGRADSGEVLGSIFSSFVDQANNKTSLRGASDLQALLSGDKKIDRFAADRIAVLVPNLLRQPVRESDPVFRERPQGFMEMLTYGMFPRGQQPAKTDLYGKPVEKPGSPLGRVFDFTDSGMVTVNRADTAIFNWNRRNPHESYAPQEPSRKFTDPITRKPSEMTTAQFAKYKEIAGRRTAAMLRSIPLNEKSPTERDIKAIKQAVDAGREQARQILFRNPNWRKMN